MSESERDQWLYAIRDWWRAGRYLNLVIIRLVARLGPHLGTAEPPAQPVSVDAPRHRPGAPSTGRTTRERARRATAVPVGPVGAPVIVKSARFPDAGRPLSRR
jgi:hypothetical protein